MGKLFLIIFLLPQVCFLQDLVKIQFQIKNNIDLNTKLISQLKDKYNQIKSIKDNISSYYYAVIEKVKISTEKDLFSKNIL